LAVSGTHPDVAVTDIVFTLASDTSDLSINTDSSYNISNTAANTLTITAQNQFGGLYALETVVQLFEDGGIPCSNLHIADAPAFKHRGLMIDTAHRFVPVAALYSIIDGMLMSKLNVLNLHVVDNNAVRVNTTKFPEVTAKDAFYGVSNISELIEYARERGVVVVPEIDAPQFSQSFSASKAFDFCANSTSQLDESDLSISSLSLFLLDLLKIFSVDHVFLGGSHGNNGCGYKSLVTTVVSAITTGSSNVVGGWDALVDSVTTANPSVAIFSRKDNAGVAALLKNGYPVVYAGSGNNFFLNSDASGNLYCNNFTCLYPNIPALGKVDGASASVWTNNYCATADCMGNGAAPVGSYLSSRSHDAAFGKSLVAMTFPRASVVGAAAWSYSPSNALSALDLFTSSLQARGLAVCPSGCACNEVSNCGNAYQPVYPPIENMQTGMVFAVVLFTVCLVVIVGAVFQSRRNRSGYVRVN